VNRDEVERALTSATEQREQAVVRLAAAETRAQELADQQDSVRGEIVIAQRSVADLTDAISRLQQAVSQLRVDEAREGLAAAVRLRDENATEAAAAIEATLGLLEQLEERRRVVADAERALQAATSTPGPPPSLEPPVLEEPLQRLDAFVRARSDAKLLDDVVTAAARSPGGNAIADLPEHLQVLARERRKALTVAAARQRDRRPERDLEPADGNNPAGSDN
jgi:chromosome segregation ATPase